MKNLVIKIKNEFINKQFFIFIILGVINTFNGTIFSYLYSKSVDVNVAFVFGYITSLGIAYILNSKFIFRVCLRISALGKFIVSYIPNFVIQNIIVIIFYNILGFPQIIAYCLAAIVGLPITFLLVKIVAFKEN